MTCNTSEVAACCSSASASFFCSSALELRMGSTRVLAFVVFERRPVMRIRLFAPLRAKITSSAQSLVPLPVGPALPILTAPHDELAALDLLRSFDHLVGERKQPVRNLKAERLRGFGIDMYLDFGSMFDGQVRGLFNLNNATGLKSVCSILLCKDISEIDEPARRYELTSQVHGWNRMACRKFNEPLDPIVKENITPDEQGPGSCLDQAREGGVDFAVGGCSQYLNL